MKKFIIACFMFLIISSPCKGFSTETMWLDFDNFPVTELNTIPGSTGDGLWLYTTATQNADSNYVMTSSDYAGWRGTTDIGTNEYEMFYKYSVTLNGASKGFENFGYLEIVDLPAVKGHALKYTVTGGVNDNSPDDIDIGTYLHTKEDFLAEVDPMADIVIGAQYLYFATKSGNKARIPTANGHNRFSFYSYTPFVSNGDGVAAGTRLEEMLTLGPYSNMSMDHVFPDGDPEVNMGGHWYNGFLTQGGGWTHHIMDGHPRHNNSFNQQSDYPYPKSSFRNIGQEYFDNLYKIYIAFKPYLGLDVPPHFVIIDELKFFTETESLNYETINNPSVVYLPATKDFEIGFFEKYLNSQHNHSTYEVRYSFSVITNANYSSATPVHIQTDARWGITANTDGEFENWNQYYSRLWAPFKIAPADESQLVEGATIYFAIKDISQNPLDLEYPRNYIEGEEEGDEGRLYYLYGSSYDFAGDEPALPLVNLIDYTIVKEPNGWDYN